MKLVNIILRGYRKILQKLFHRSPNHPLSRNEIHEFWKQPSRDNLPHIYLKGEARSLFLVEKMRKYAKSEARILEIGCNVGRNLNYLFLDGFKNLSGIEINKNAIQLLKKSYPEMAKHTKIYNAPVEEVITNCKNEEFDVVFTMACLEHIHTDSEWVFSEIVRVTKEILITIEDELGVSWKHFPRDYKKIFEAIGLKQVEEINCNEIDELGAKFLARIFKKS